MVKPDQHTKFAEVWDSLEPEIIEDLERLHHRLNTVKREAQFERVSNDVIRRAMTERFWTLWTKIGEGTA